jgi:hypothetical protein
MAPAGLQVWSRDGIQALCGTSADIVSFVLACGEKSLTRGFAIVIVSSRPQPAGLTSRRCNILYYHQKVVKPFGIRIAFFQLKNGWSL